MALGDNDKTEAPTGKRKKEARKKGEIAKTPELALWGELLVASFVIPATASHMMETATLAMGGLRGIDSRSGPEVMFEWLRFAAEQTVLIVAPLTLAVLGTAVVSNVLQTGFVASFSLLKPRFDRLNPLKGLKRLFSPESLWNLVKMVLKTLVLAGVAWPMSHSLVESLLSNGRPELGATVLLIGSTSLDITRRIAMAGLLLALVDYGLAQRRIRKSLRMSKQEIREEGKQQEGNPESKAGIKRRQLAVSRNRMISSVADASVVIVNPTHVAVAIVYREGERAPKVVAKGKGVVALKIRERAEQHGVPIVRDVPLARTLHDACDVDEEIPASLYEAVAKVLAFLFTVRRAAFGGDLVLPG